MTSTQSHASSSDAQSHHLVGRALVPFFDAEENVNASMEVDPMTQLYEPVDVDARVWDKTLGYFVYPKEKPPKTSVSTPIAIKNQSTVANKSPIWNGNGGNSMLLTPDFLLSRSAPNVSTTSLSTRQSSPQTTALETTRISPYPTHQTDSKGTTRSTSAQRSSTRSKSRSNTPNRNRLEKSNSSKSASPPSTIESNTTSKKKRSSKDKVKEELSTSGKWAWSAFQNSPDPKSLPLPPSFITNSPLLSASNESGNLTMALELPPPRVPPDTIVKSREKGEEVRGSIEHSMTEDLRRMLNIGGG